MSFVNFSGGGERGFESTYTALEPGTRIGYTTRFDDPNLPGEMQVEVLLSAVSCGTELQIVQSGIPAVIPTELCYLGWQESLSQLAVLVEPDIPDGA
jgi:uncharacterized protein YndB with AHSA1/START domain